MPSTITALFDDRAEAEAARERLKTVGVGAENIHVHDKTSPGYDETGYSTHQNRGIWESIKHAFLPDEDRHTYEEGVRRGGVLLTADVDADRVDEATRVLEDANSVDVENRADAWRESGWQQPAGGTAAGLGASAPDTLRESDRGDLRADREEVIPIVEEQLVVGKRDVSRGGARVRSYVTEVPVHEQIRLREEQVNVERRKVDQPLSEGDADAFRERTIDMTATGEEAVIGKKARVVEEVVISKTAQEREETIDDTVRHTDVEIDRDAEDVERRSTAGVGNRDDRI